MFGHSPPSQAGGELSGVCLRESTPLNTVALTTAPPTYRKKVGKQALTNSPMNPTVTPAYESLHEAVLKSLVGDFLMSKLISLWNPSNFILDRDDLLFLIK